MLLKPESTVVQDYLLCTAIIDYSHPAIAQQASQLAGRSGSVLELIRNTYEFVRDAISHSADIEGRTVTCKASEVLNAREGLCYAKSHLLAALLRHNGIPAGFCYQLLSSRINPGAPLVLHGLTAVYLEDLRKWTRLDARGNKSGINAQFSTASEHLAYAVHPEKGEKNFPDVFVSPDSNVIRTLTDCKDLATLWRNLPQCLNRQAEPDSLDIPKAAP